MKTKSALLAFSRNGASYKDSVLHLKYGSQFDLKLLSETFFSIVNI